jgi:hypothetical protein
MTFRMTLDRCQRTLTILAFVSVFLAGVTVLVATQRLLPLVVTLALALGPLAVAAAYAPAGVEVVGRELRILRRQAAPIRLSVDEVVAVEDGPPCADLRLFGTRGFLGKFGLYWTIGIGRHWLYATRRGPALVLRRRHGLPVVLVVDDSENLRQTLGRWRQQDGLAA